MEQPEWLLSQHPKGGPALRALHLHLDESTGKTGYLLAYESDGRKVILPYERAAALAKQLAPELCGLKKHIHKRIPKQGIVDKVAKAVVGWAQKRQEYQLQPQMLHVPSDRYYRS